MAITHETVASGERKIGIDDWNDDHKIVNLLGYEFVEEKVIESPTTNCTFSDLDGDTDEEYFIEGDIDWSSVSGADVSLQMTYNSIVSNYQSSGGRYFAGIHEVINKSNQEIIMGGWVAACSSYFKAKVRVKTGRVKIGYVTSGCYNISGHTTTNIYHTVQLYCDNTADNVTSITLTGVNGSFAGTIRLWKKIPI